MYLLDTNVVSEIRKPRPHGAVISWYRQMGEGSMRIPSIVLYELQSGAELLRERDPTKAAELDAWIHRIHVTETILDFDAASAREAARLMKGRSLDLFEDAMIAAIAITNRLTVATRNIKDFSKFGVGTVDPFVDKRD